MSSLRVPYSLTTDGGGVRDNSATADLYKRSRLRSARRRRAFGEPRRQRIHHGVAVVCLLARFRIVDVEKPNARQPAFVAQRPMGGMKGGVLLHTRYALLYTSDEFLVVMRPTLAECFLGQQCAPRSALGRTLVADIGCPRQLWAVGADGRVRVAVGRSRPIVPKGTARPPHPILWVRPQYNLTSRLQARPEA